MANQAHLVILQRGVEAWNHWRKENPEIIPDLSRASFNGASLSGANFRKANLYHTSFNGADLRKTNLEDTDLSTSQLMGAFLCEANLSQACLFKANLFKADLARSNLSEANFYQAQLSETNLIQANLSEANLMNTCLRRANLSRAKLFKADLSQANLSESNSLSTDFEEAILTEANITNWDINEKTNFENIDCDYICLGENQRYPQKGKIFEFGDFEEFVRELQKVTPHNSERQATDNQRERKQNIKTPKIIDLNFNQGIDWQAFLNSYEELGVEVGEDSIPIQDIKYKRDGTVIIYIQSPPGYEQESVIKFIQEQYQQQFKNIDKVSNQERRDQEREIAEYKRHNIDLLEIIKNQAKQPVHVNQEQNFNINNYDHSTNDFQNIWGDGNQVVKGNKNNFVEGNDNTIGSRVTSSSELQQNSISEIIFSIIKSRLVGWLLYMILVLSVMAFIIWLPIVISHQSTPKQPETEVQGRNNP